MKNNKKIKLVLTTFIICTFLFVALFSCKPQNSQNPPKPTDKVIKTSINNNYLTNDNIMKDLASCFGNLFYNISQEKISSMPTANKQISVEATFRANLKNKEFRFSIILNNDLDDGSKNTISFLLTELNEEVATTGKKVLNLILKQRDFTNDNGPYPYEIYVKIENENSFIIPFSSKDKLIPIKLTREEINDSIASISSFLAASLYTDKRQGSYYKDTNDSFYTREYDIVFDLKETLKKLAENSRAAKNNPGHSKLTLEDKIQIIDLEDVLTSIVGLNLTHERNEFAIADGIVDKGMPPGTLSLKFKVKNIDNINVFGGDNVLLKSFEAEIDIKADESTKDSNFRFKGQAYSSKFTMETFEHKYSLNDTIEHINKSKYVNHKENFIVFKSEIVNFNSPQYEFLNEKINTPGNKTILEIISKYVPPSINGTGGENGSIFSVRLYNQNTLMINNPIEELFSLYVKGDMLYINALTADNTESNTEIQNGNVGESFIDDFNVALNDYYKFKITTKYNKAKADGEQVPENPIFLAFSPTTILAKLLSYFYVNSNIKSDNTNIYIDVSLLIQTVLHLHKITSQTDINNYFQHELIEIVASQTGSTFETIQEKLHTDGFTDGFFFDEKVTFELSSEKLSDMIKVLETLDVNHKILDSGDANLKKLERP